MKGLIVTLLILIAAGIGYSIYEREGDKRRIEEHERVKMQTHERVATLIQKRELEVKRAILEGRAIRGMNSYEVYKAWGHPILKRKHDIDEDWRQQGVYEIWEFNQGFLGIGIDGDVLGLGTWKN